MKFTKGDLFQSDAEAIVNTVNCVGIMGKGIAKGVKERYPDVYKEYRSLCDMKQMRPGKILTVPTNELIGAKYIVNFPTKRHWRNNSRLDDIELGLESLVEEIKQLGFKSIAIPPLGCGNGGLNWKDVKPLVIKYLKGIKDIEITVFEPPNYIEEVNIPNSIEELPKLTEERITLLNLLLLYCKENYAISLNEIHNLAYILQSTGKNLSNLDFELSNTGVTSKSLNLVLNNLNTHYFSSFSSKGKTSYVKFTDEQMIEKLKNDRNINRSNAEILELLKGFKSEAGIELFAKVLWELRNGKETQWETKYSYLHCSDSKKEVSERIIKSDLLISDTRY